MTIKKVTIADLENVRGGADALDKVTRGEKKAIKQLTKEYNKDLTTKNNTPREPVPINSPNGV